MVASGGTIVAETDRPPNLLIIVADDLGYETLNCYGGLDFQTPRLNRMADEGLRFTRAYTSPVCTPSRVSLHTGLYVPRHGHDRVLPVHRGTTEKVDFDRHPTFAQHLRRSGYATATTGKWQMATLEAWPNHIADAGFDHWCVWQIWKDGSKTSRHWDPTFNRDGSVREDLGDRFGPDVLADYVIEQMSEAARRQQPFLIVHNELLPHDPMVQTPWDRRRNRPASLGHMIAYMDGLVGRVLDAVENLGIRDETYVFFIGDNGTHEEDFQNPHADRPTERAHTRHTEAGLVNGGKFKMGDAGTHVPLLVWGPPSVSRGVCNDLVDIVDVFPTVFDLACVDTPPSDGRSLEPQIHGRSGTPRRWTHQQIAPAGGKSRDASGKRTSTGPFRGASLFDGRYRWLARPESLWSTFDLPRENKHPEGPEAAAAAAALSSELRRIVPDGPLGLGVRSGFSAVDTRPSKPRAPLQPASDR